MWIYSFIRADISLAQQIVQTAHSAYESGRGLGRNVPFPRLVLLQVVNGEELDEALQCCSAFVQCYPFYETEQGLANQLTSFTTRPVTAPERALFRGYKLWKLWVWCRSTNVKRKKILFFISTKSIFKTRQFLCGLWRLGDRRSTSITLIRRSDFQPKKRLITLIQKGLWSSKASCISIKKMLE